jgi:hypothetical protein
MKNIELCIIENVCISFVIFIYSVYLSVLSSDVLYGDKEDCNKWQKYKIKIIEYKIVEFKCITIYN